ncbi:MAG: hypothetical protein V3V85_03595 [Candidatus Thorarchaeota archaeon]
MITTNSRKEMIPAPVREVHKSGAFCKPEWDLLCRIRYSLKHIVSTKSPSRVRDVRKVLIGIIANMDDVFDDWPEDPK